MFEVRTQYIPECAMTSRGMLSHALRLQNIVLHTDFSSNSNFELVSVYLLFVGSQESQLLDNFTLLENGSMAFLT